MWKEEWGVLRRIRRYPLHRRKMMCEFRSLFLFWRVNFEKFTSLRLSRATWDSDGSKSDFHFWHHSSKRRICVIPQRHECDFKSFNRQNQRHESSCFVLFCFLNLIVSFFKKNTLAPVPGAAHQLTWITWFSVAGSSSKQEMCADSNHVTVEWSCCFLSSPPCLASTMSQSVSSPAVSLWAAVRGRNGSDARLTWGNGPNVK